MEHLHVSSGQMKLLMLVVALLAMHGAAHAETTIVNQSPVPVLVVGLINLQATTSSADDATSSEAAASRALWKQEAATWGATSALAVRAAMGKLAEEEEAASAVGALAVGPSSQVAVPPFFLLPGNFSLVNQANGRAVGPVSLLDGSLLMVKGGLIRSTVDVLLGALINGVVTLLQTIAKSL